MGTFIDLTNRQFERLTVIKRVENNKQGRTMWLCKKLWLLEKRTYLKFNYKTP